MKSRLDKLLFQRGLAPSRERAQALILAGRVLVNEQKLEKAGTRVEEDVAIRVLGDDQPFVSRGGLKLARALEHWRIDVRDKCCMDVGASTGGFTDCLLQSGASRVLAVDTGYGQMDPRVRADPRVQLLEKTNARYLTPEQIWANPGTRELITLVAMDVSFISATLVLPAVVRCARASSLGNGFDLVLLVKPQFEVGRGQVGKGGIVRDPQAQQGAVTKVADAVQELGGTEIEVIESPIFGAEGNREFLLHACFPPLPAK
ncbi:MAG: TlyA family RNA methyltransferase [Candidatus Korobacteraceae bacterium]